MSVGGADSRDVQLLGNRHEREDVVVVRRLVHTNAYCPSSNR